MGAARSPLAGFALAAAVLGCGSGSTGQEPQDPPAETAGSGLRGTLMTESQEPLGRSTVMACMTKVCLLGETDAQGRFEFQIDAPENVAVKTHADLSRRPRLAAALYPVRFRGSALLEMDTVYVPELPFPGTPLPARGSGRQTLDLGDGLELSFDRGDLTPALGDVLVDVAARRLAREQIPPLPDIAAGDVLAVYALHPFAAKSRSPIAALVRAGLPKGPILFRTISEIDGTLSAPVPGHSSGEVASTDAGLGIMELTWLVLSRK
jgi:hypothetical protein